MFGRITRTVAWLIVASAVTSAQGPAGCRRGHRLVGDAQARLEGLQGQAACRHARRHFDLAEVYARRVRKLFRELRDPCPRSDAELMGMAEKVIKEHWRAQRRYDLETENGQIERRQNDWQRKIAGELAALAEYAEVSRLTSKSAR